MFDESRENIQIRSSRTLLLFGFLIPTVTVLTPLLPQSLSFIAPLYLFIVVPLFFLYFTEKPINYFYLLILVFVLFLQSLGTLSDNFDNAFRGIVLVILSVIFFSIGLKSFRSNKHIDIWKGIHSGILIVNVISFSLFLGIIFDFFDPYEIYENFGRENEVGLFEIGWRFALGNAIQVPFILASLLSASSLFLMNKGINIAIFPLLLNLVNALISQSRVVILISLLLFLLVAFKKKNFYLLAFLLVTILFSTFIYWDILNELFFSSLFQRFSGDDYGSVNDRLKIFELFWYNTDWLTLLFGSGASNSSFFMSYELSFTPTVDAYVYRSPESMFIQLIYEHGLIFFFFMIFIALEGNYGSIRNIVELKPLAFLIFLEQFFLLQIAEFSFLILLVLGVLVADKKI
tara:strand:- start:7341 stop:8549 length:1209 start_codon:yes stop_codon:yes gene_type:complete